MGLWESYIEVTLLKLAATERKLRNVKLFKFDFLTCFMLLSALCSAFFHTVCVNCTVCVMPEWLKHRETPVNVDRS